MKPVPTTVFQQAQEMANRQRETIVIILAKGKFYAIPAVRWMCADGEIKGITKYKFCMAVDPE
jgi:hypothetical protein